MGFPNPLEAIAGIVGVVGNVIDEVHTSPEEKLQLKAGLLQIQTEFATNALNYERALAEAQASIVKAEAESSHWLTSTWRPITMLTFVFLIVWSQFTGMEIPPDLWFVVKLGLGGYVIGRSAEKVVPSAMAAMKAREEA